jgi:hypothetical protein
VKRCGDGREGFGDGWGGGISGAARLVTGGGGSGKAKNQAGNDDSRDCGGD